MKLTEKERIMLLVLAVVTVWGVGIALILLPSYETYQQRQTELLVVQDEQQQLELQLLQALTIDKEIEQSYEQAKSNAALFYSHMQTYEADILVKDLLSKRDITIESMDIAPIALAELSTYRFEQAQITYPIAQDAGQSVASSEAEEKISETVPAISVSVEYEGEYEDIKSVLQDITELNKSIYVQSVSINDMEDQDAVPSGTMNFVIYCVQEIADLAQE